jgi:hypothetical protein
LRFISCRETDTNGTVRSKKYTARSKKASKLLQSFGQICQQFYRNLAEEEEKKDDEEAISKLAVIL